MQVFQAQLQQALFHAFTKVAWHSCDEWDLPVAIRMLEALGEADGI